jgi:hypothetical protein
MAAARIVRGFAAGTSPVTCGWLFWFFHSQPYFSKPRRDRQIEVSAETACPAPVFIYFAPNTPMDTGAMRICTCRVHMY